MNLTQNFDQVWPQLKGLSTSSAVNDNGDMEKILAMVVLGFGSFLAGMLPAFISERNRRRFPLGISLMLCFGAGVLLATALVHILPEVRKQMNSNWAEVSICAGFFFIYFTDEFLHYLCGEPIQHSHTYDSGHSHTATISNNHRHNYGSLQNSESRPLLDARNMSTQSNDESEDNANQHFYQRDSVSDHNHDHHNVPCNDEVVANANARICHTSHREPCSESRTGTVGLFAALCLHSAIEGLAIGVQNSSTKVLFLLGAVACHKFVMGLCLGLILRSNPLTPLKSQITGIAMFALGTICGIGLGMIIVDVPSSWSITVLPVIQGLAGGTLLYVTTSEVIPREKVKFHMNPDKQFAGFAQFLMVALGFTIMCVLNFNFDDDA